MKHSLQSKDKITVENDETISQALYLKRQSKSWEAFQQSVLMGILVKQGYTFHIIVPEKYSNKVSHLFKIQSIEKNGTIIQIEELIRNECEKLYQLESSKISDSSQIKRHMDKNRVSIGLNTLLKEVQQLGYTVKKRGTRGSQYTVIAEKFSEISFDEKVVYDKNTIRKIGKLINDHLLLKCKSIKKNQTITFSVDDMNQIKVTETGETPSAFLRKPIQFNQMNHTFFV